MPSGGFRFWPTIRRWDPRTMMGWPPNWTRLLLLPALVVGFTVHELAHALVAYLLGDTSQVSRKRLSFNPLRHVSVPGMFAFMLLGIGWAKPVSVDPGRFRMRNQPFGMFLVSVSGALANLLAGLASIVGLSLTGFVVGVAAGVPWGDVVRYLVTDQVALDLHGLVVALSYYMFSVNVLLALFNLIPLPPLDGFNALIGLAGAAQRAFGKNKSTRKAQSPDATATQSEEDDRSPAQIHFDIGLSYHREGRLDEAIARYRQALGQAQGFSLAHYNLGLAFWAKERPDLAAQAFKAAALGPDVPLRAEAEHRLRELALAQGDSAVGQPVLPVPLETSPASVTMPPVADSLDPTVRRRLWLRLILGGIGLVALALGAWIFVTLFTLSAFAPS
jgi:Zn-dependent protease